MSFAEACGLDELEGDWSRVKTIIPYGFGADAHRTLKRIFQDFDIPFIVDRDETKWGMRYLGGQKGLRGRTVQKNQIQVAHMRGMQYNSWRESSFLIMDFAYFL